jgi:hypothetical protein
MTLAVLLLFLAFYPKTDLFAASVKLVGISDDHSYIGVAVTEPLSSSYQYYELKVTNGSNIVAEAQTSGKNILINGLSRNKVYDLYVRTVTEDPITYEITYSNWTHVKKFSTSVPDFGTNSKKKVKGVWIKPPKIKGVTKYNVYIGYSKSNTWSNGMKFKKVCTIKPGKKKKITRYKGKSFKSKKGMYYFRVVPQNKKVKSPCYSTLNNWYEFRYTVYTYLKY